MEWPALSLHTPSQDFRVTESMQAYPQDFWRPHLSLELRDLTSIRRRAMLVVQHYLPTLEACALLQEFPGFFEDLQVPRFSVRSDSRLFQTFPIVFVGPLPVGPYGERYLLVVVEHLISWPMIHTTAHDTALIVIKFILEIIRPSCPPDTSVSNNSKCFRATSTTSPMRT